MTVLKTENKKYSTPYEKVPQWGRIPLFIFFTLLIFFSLKYTFYAYVGLLDPKGEYSLPFLEKFSLIQGILNLLVYPSGFFLNLLGYDTILTYNSVKIAGSGAVRIAFPCMGIEIMLSLIALILAYPGKNKKIYLFAGVTGVHTINIIRVTGLALLRHLDTKVKFPGHDVFNFICYSFIIIIFYWWVKNHSTDLLYSPKRKQQQ
ncbi:MAG: exosortase/archaeosortase family protein [Sporocytophaga sp.]|uniref:exosortase/archaeosortase family protein n=1 Tax=Sporocytophaga sp. TaxID=2231183 RepID=UPI001B0C9067|nr:exosortase/archaeosortase family protein [Sporocytophaga sp.]MBO9699705.1 exosortase/archaeosortase family protein [Sporocytophaga sp.]